MNHQVIERASAYNHFVKSNVITNISENISGMNLVIHMM